MANLITSYGPALDEITPEERGRLLRYCVRVTDSGLEGWLPVGDLRSTRTPSASPPPVPPSRTAVGALESETSGRRFGQRPS